MPIVTVFGGAGFIGRQVVLRMARRGWRVRVGTRDPNRTGAVRVQGEVGQVEPVACNVRDDASVRAALARADAAANLVGILHESGRQRFATVHAESAGRVARIAAELGAARLVHVSAIGADAESESAYARSKAEGEERVAEAFPAAVILRPSIVFGEGDQFFNRFAAMAALAPVLPLVGADTRFQPIHVGDVAAAVEAALLGRAEAGVYELGGPQTFAFRELMAIMLREIRRRRLLLPVPFAIAEPMGMALGVLPNPPLTADQVAMLRSDNIVAPGARTLGDLGLAATPVESVIGAQLARFRPGGQYATLTDRRRSGAA